MASPQLQTEQQSRRKPHSLEPQIGTCYYFLFRCQNKPVQSENPVKRRQHPVPGSCVVSRTVSVHPLELTLWEEAQAVLGFCPLVLESSGTRRPGDGRETSLLLILIPDENACLLQPSSPVALGTRLRACASAQPCLTLHSPTTAARQAPLSTGFSLARILEWVAISSPRQSSRPRDGTHVSCIGKQTLYR